jgi:hypothetical protein
MKSDRYTKVVLTVIAMCLVYQVSSDIVSKAYAQQTMSVNIVSVGGIYQPGVLSVHAQ